MAITWTPMITPMDPATVQVTKRVTIRATRVDSEDPTHPWAGTAHTILEPNDGETPAQMRDRIAADIKAAYDKAMAREAQVVAVVSDYEVQLKTALEALEA